MTIAKEKRKNVVDKTDLAAVIGSRLKNFRKEADYTLKQLAEMTDLSVPLLSKIENGAVMPSVPALQALAIALRVDVGEFFRGKDESGFVLSRPGNRKIIGQPDLTKVEFLFSEDSGGVPMFMEPAVMTIFKRDEVPARDTYRHEGQEFQYVLEGRIELSLGNKKIRLKAGEAIYWDSTIPHAVNSVDKRPAKTFNVHLVPGRRSGEFQRRLEAGPLNSDNNE
ncbi:MAG: XRE family transcriptional regulator [Syntrophorhabdales bacterium]|jgi:transcriptional regulator with XRE-family HTH domain